jgi:hypothetical protein
VATRRALSMISLTMARWFLGWWRRCGLYTRVRGSAGAHRWHWHSRASIDRPTHHPSTATRGGNAPADVVLLEEAEKRGALQAKLLAHVLRGGGAMRVEFD